MFQCDDEFCNSLFDEDRYCFRLLRRMGKLMDTNLSTRRRLYQWNHLCDRRPVPKRGRRSSK